MSYTEIDETGAGLTLGTSSASKVGFFAGAPAAKQANTVVARTALQNLGIIASGGTDTTAYKNAANTFSADITLADDVDVIVNATTGTKIGTAVTQKLGFWNATPIVQPASADQAALGARTLIGDNTGTSGVGLSLIGDTTAVNQASNIMNDFAALQEDIAAIGVLLNALQRDLVNAGIIKGEA